MVNQIVNAAVADREGEYLTFMLVNEEYGLPDKDRALLSHLCM